MKLSLISIILLAINSIIANGQKQPQVQETGVRAPDRVKIDGKLNEWQNPFYNPQKYAGFLSAFNSSSRVYYTVANDDQNLYLVVRGLGNGVTKKLLAGGLTFTISHATDKKGRIKDPSNVAIGFPMPNEPKTTSFIMSTINQVQDFTDDTVAHRKSIDSLDAIAYKMVNDAAKEMRVAGIKEIKDSVISIYNTEGIKASIRFIQVQTAIEISIPLKYLGLSVDNPTAFSYNIRIAAIPEASRAYAQTDPNMPAPIVVVGNGGTAPMPIAAMNTNPNNGYAWNPTDFWGEYVLVKSK